MTAPIRFTPLPNERVRGGPATVAASNGISLRADRPTYAWPQAVWDQIDLHARSSRLEVAGLLAGRVWTDGAGLAFVSVEAAVPADWGVDTSATHVSFHPEAWDRLGPALLSLPDNPVVVGWYHSHPGLSAFFSGTDRQTQAGAFRESWQIGVVVDPINRERTAFRGPDSLPVDPGDIVEISASIVEAREGSTVRPKESEVAVAAKHADARRRGPLRGLVAGIAGFSFVALATMVALRRLRQCRTS